MKARHYAVLSAVVVCAIAAGFIAYRHQNVRPPGADYDETETGRRHRVELSRTQVHLYFSNPDERSLRAEDRLLDLPDSVAEQARAILVALIKGTKGELVRTLPAETDILAVYLAQDGICYVDFNAAIGERHPGGTLAELLTVYSVVNSITLNVAEIKAVKFLIEGRESETLAGHIDTRFPFQPNMLMIK